jgi:hypothetical protein
MRSRKRVRKPSSRFIYIGGVGVPFPSEVSVGLQNVNNTNFLKLFLASNPGYLTYLLWHIGDTKYGSGLKCYGPGDWGNVRGMYGRIGGRNMSLLRKQVGVV